MYDEQAGTRRLSAVISRLRKELGEKTTQSMVARQAGLDQSRVSRIEKGDVSNSSDIKNVLDALVKLGSVGAGEYRDFAAREWTHIEPPSFWNPQRAVLETAEKTLAKVAKFLADKKPQWPLQRAIEADQATLLRGAAYLNKLTHSIAFIGKIGVGKSMALAFAFDLLVPPSPSAKPSDRTVLEVGSGGITICEVHIRRGPEFGLAVQPLSDKELHDLITDFCAAKWIAAKVENKALREVAKVSSESERAIRNMSGLVRKPKRGETKTAYHDPVQDLIHTSETEEEFRTHVIAMMRLGERTCRDLWYQPSLQAHPLKWLAKVFRDVNNGRLPDVSLPKSIDLVIPAFGREFGELDVTVIDTKGVEDIAVRPDLDLRLRDPRTAVVLCSNFNDAPGVIAKGLLDHMRQTFTEPLTAGKASIMALPRNEEARAVKDDSGETVLSDEEGYALKAMQVENGLNASDPSNIPVFFFNAQSDSSEEIRKQLVGQLSEMRRAAAQRLADLCAAVDDLINRHKEKAMVFAVQGVAERLLTFLDDNSKLRPRETLAHREVIAALKSVSHASTLWAATRRSGEYSGLNLVHQIGVGAARDAVARSMHWFAFLENMLKGLKKDKGLAIAAKTIDQIGKSAAVSRMAFLDAIQRAGMEVYHTPLSNSDVWTECAHEWGKGPGFTIRIAGRLEDWFENQPQLKDQLEDLVNRLWETTVMAPLRRLADEAAPAPDATNIHQAG